MTLQIFNEQDKATASDRLFTCCGSGKWLALLMKEFPFSSEKELVRSATNIWYEACTSEDWREAFDHHPKIGDVKSLEKKFADTKHLAGAEQAGIATASRDVIIKLAAANSEYEEKFGYIFIVCATGKSAEEMLSLLRHRLENSEEEEIKLAMGEQHKITIIRLKKLLHQADWSWMKPSQLTTHVLDTSVGKPGSNMSIRLQHRHEGVWKTFAQGVTNTDGRIADLLPPEKYLLPDTYKLLFDTGDYLRKNGREGFYPEVEIQFSVRDEAHYHVPLLINPFGYSTYRGS